MFYLIRIYDHYFIIIKLSIQLFWIYLSLTNKIFIFYSLIEITIYLKSLILLWRNFLMFQGRSLCPSTSGVSCSNLSARRRRSCSGAPGGARRARGPATHAVPATSTNTATQHQRRWATVNPYNKIVSYKELSRIFSAMARSAN